MLWIKPFAFTDFLVTTIILAVCVVVLFVILVIIGCCIVQRWMKKRKTERMTKDQDNDEYGNYYSPDRKRLGIKMEVRLRT